MYYFSVFLCRITHYHNLNDLKQHMFIISQFPGAEVWHGLNESFTQNLKKRQSRCQQGYIFIWKPHWGRTLPRCTSIAVWQHSFPGSCGAEAPLLHLPAGGLPQSPVPDPLSRRSTAWQFASARSAGECLQAAQMEPCSAV